MRHLRRIIYVPPALLIVIGLMLLSAPSAAQQFNGSAMLNFASTSANHERAAQASFVKHRDRMIARVYAARAEARQDRRQRREARQDAAQAAAYAAQQAAATPSPQPSPVGNVSTVGMSAFEACVINNESGGNPGAVNPSSGAGGLFQFLPSTWASLGYAAAYPGGAQTAPVSVQYQAFFKLYAEAGTAPWSGDGCA